jgi:DNA-binding response OmpR family regulator
MEQVLIVDPDPVHAIALKESLEAANYFVSVHRDHRTAMQAVGSQGISTVVFVSSSPSWWRNDLKAFCESAANTKQAMDVICLLRWPSIGPTDRLFGDELNVRVLHEE